MVLFGLGLGIICARANINSHPGAEMIHNKELIYTTSGGMIHLSLSRVLRIGA